MKKSYTKKRPFRVKKRIKKLESAVAQSLATFTYRSIGASRANCDMNAWINSFFNMNSLPQINTILSRLRYYDSTTNAIVERDQVDDNSTRSFEIPYTNMDVFMRNIGLHTLRYEVYSCRCKKNTSLTPLSTYVLELGDNSNMTSITDLATYPMDSPSVRTIWEIKRLGSGYLLPGRILRYWMRSKPFKVNTSLGDIDDDNYLTRLHSYGLWVRICGTVALGDGVAPADCVSRAYASYEVRTTTKVRYDAGQKFNYVYYQNNLDAATGAVAPSMPEAGPVNDVPIAN